MNALENPLGRKLKATDPGLDAVDFRVEGKAWDVIGHPNASTYWSAQRSNFLSQINQHLAKGDQVVLDLRGFDPSQRAEVVGYVATLPDADQLGLLRFRQRR